MEIPHKSTTPFLSFNLSEIRKEEKSNSKKPLLTGCLVYVVHAYFVYHRKNREQKLPLDPFAMNIWKCYAMK